MKKRILILSCMAASIFSAFVMPFGIGYGTPVVSATETDGSEEEQSAEDVLQDALDDIESGEIDNTEDELDEETIAQYSASVSDEDIISYSEQNIELLVGLDLSDYDPETSVDAAMVDDWYAIKDEVGAYVSTDTATVERDGRKLMGIIDATCENAKVRFTVTFDVVNGLESISAVNLNGQEEEETSLAENMKNAGINTLLGMGTVFVMLIVMSFIISLMKYIPQLLTPKQKAPEPVSIPVPAPVTAVVPAPEEDLSNDEELVAVISAAIAAYEGENSIDGFVVRSIRRH